MQTHATEPEEQPTARNKAPSETVVIDRFWRNRRGEAIVTTIEQYDRAMVLHVRTNFTAKSGVLTPTKKGICININKLPDLHRALTKALQKARELGLLEEAPE